MIAKDGNNLFDIVTQSTGDINNLFDVLRNNNISADSNTKSGQVINIPSTSKEKEVYAVSTITQLDTIKTVVEGQNNLDLAIQFFGDISYLFTILRDNNININERLQSGTSIIVNNKNQGDENIKRLFIRNNIKCCNYQNLGDTALIDGDYNIDYNGDYL